MRPPTRESDSRTSGVRPRSFTLRAAASPAMPPPTTTTSGDCPGESGKAASLDEVDGCRGPRVGDVGKVLGHRLEPLLPARHVIDDRPEDQVIVEIVAMLE